MRFTATSPMVVEGLPEQLLCVQHEAVLEREFTVNITFQDNTTSPEDFDHTPLAITFDPDSNLTQCVELVINFDDILESDEVFLALLTTADTDVQVMDGTAVVTVIDSSVLVVGFTAATFTLTEGEATSDRVCVAILNGELAPGEQLLISVELSDPQGNDINNSFCLPQSK